MISIALDLGEDKMYLLNALRDKIYRTGLSGSPVEIFDDRDIDICGLAINEGGGKIYWTELYESGIVRANLDGSQRETIVSEPEGCVRAIDASQGKIYWEGRGGIQRANLDGSQRETLFLKTRTGDIAIDEGGGKIYWTDDFDDVIRRANLDGSQSESIAGAGSPYGIALGP